MRELKVYDKVKEFIKKHPVLTGVSAVTGVALIVTNVVSNNTKLDANGIAREASKKQPGIIVQGEMPTDD